MLKKTLLKWITHSATVTHVSDPARNFRSLTLHSDAFRNRTSTPGDKIRMVVGDGLLRTYTPFDWNDSAGTASLLAYHREEGSASRWLSGLHGGETCQVLGPQPSTALDRLQRPAVFVGDETSIALAHALKNTAAGIVDVGFLFEVSSLVETGKLLTAIDITASDLVERTADDSHLALLERRLLDLVGSEAPRQFVFSGRSSTIQHLSRSLKRLGQSSAQMMVKVFWAPGKQALD